MLPPKGLLKFLKVDSLVHNLTEYIETRVALVKVEIKDEIAKSMRAALIYVAMALVGFFFLIFLSLTLALVLNTVLDSPFWGFAIITGLYLIVLLILYSLRHSPKLKNMFVDGSTHLLKDKKKSGGTALSRQSDLEPAASDFERAHIDFEPSDRETQASSSPYPPQNTANRTL